MTPWSARARSDGYAYDVLTEAEFEWRLGQLSQANTSAQVDTLVADLTAPLREALPGMMVEFDVSPVMGSPRNDASNVPVHGVWSAQGRVSGSAVLSTVWAVREPGR